MKNDSREYNIPIDIQGFKIPPIADWKKFEQLCRDLWKNDSEKFEHVDLNGRRGQKQHGVDIYGRYIESGNWFGLSCKARQGTLEESTVKEDIEKARNFRPCLSEYIFVTTASRDANIQEVINKTKGYDFLVGIKFIEDILEELQDVKNHEIFYKYYHDLFVDNTRYGYSIGKLLSLHLGVEDNFDTTYELMIGYIPRYEDNKPVKQGYYKNTYYRNSYYIANFSDRTIEFFNCKNEQDKMKPICFPSDIEAAFRNEYDRMRICRWLTSLGDINKVLYSGEEHFHFSITRDQSIMYRQDMMDDQY